MTYITLLFSFITVLQSTTSLSDTLYTDSSIRAATVFQNTAQINRSASADLSKGINTVVFTGVSPSVLPSSVMIRSDIPFSIVSMTVGRNFLDKGENRPEIRLLQQRLDSLVQERSFLSTELNIIGNKINFVNGLRDLTGDTKYSAEELKALLDLYGSELIALERERLEKNKTSQKLDELIRRIRSQIQDLGGGQQTYRNQIVAVIRAERSGNANFDLKYLVRNVTWRPKYDIRSEGDQGQISISMTALISQNTGIDWTGIDLSIDSGNPLLGNQIPEISPLRAGFRPESKAVNFEAEMAMDAAGRNEIDAQKVVETRAASLIRNQFSSNQTSFSYRIGEPASIPSGARDYQLEIRRDTADADFLYRTLPAYQETVFLTARIPDWDNLNLISGEAHIYSEDRYLGKQFINSDEVADTLSLSFGADERISISREKLVDFTEKRFFGNRVRDTRSFEITIRNNRQQPAEIEILDQIPVSTNEKISIKASGLSGGSLNEETGIITWKLMLEPGESRTLRFGFEVEYPKGEQVLY